MFMVRIFTSLYLKNDSKIQKKLILTNVERIPSRGNTKNVLLRLSEIFIFENRRKATLSILLLRNICEGGKNNCRTFTTGKRFVNTDRMTIIPRL